MELLKSFDIFPADLNPTVKALVYFLILVHILIVTGLCIYAIPKMFPKSSSFSDTV